MNGWGEFALAYALFLTAHLVPARPAVCARLVAALGRRTYLAGYSALSIGLLLWMIRAAGRAPYLLLWPWAPWQSWAPNLAMPLVCLLAAAALLTPNPYSLGRGGSFDPRRPGVLALTRHPLLWALALWATTHALANGDLSHVLLFGGFALLALAGMPLFNRRMRRTRSRVSPAGQSSDPAAAWPVRRPGRGALALMSPATLLLGVLLYLTLFMIHPLLTGGIPARPAPWPG